MAIIYFEPFIPTKCCIAPEIPTEKYSLGDTVCPELPICLECSSQPASTTGLDAPI